MMTCWLLCVWITGDSVWAPVVESRLQRDSSLVLRANWERASPNLVRQYLLTLGQNGDPSGLEKIRAYFEDPELADTALFAYGEVEGASLDPLIEVRPKLSRDHLPILAEALSKLAPEPEFPRLTTFWEGLPEPAQHRALFYLWRNKTDALTQAAVRALSKNPSAALDGFVYYLYRSRTEIDPDFLIRLFHGTKSDPQTLIYATRIRPSQPSPELDRAYAALCRASDWRVRVNAYNGIADPSLKKSLGLALLNDVNTNVVKTALLALVGLADDVLDQNLIDSHSGLSPAHLAAVTAAAGAERVKKFLPLVQSWRNAPWAWQRRQWFSLAGAHGGEEMVAMLEAQLKLPSSGEAALAFQALGVRKRLDANHLEAAFSSENPYLMSAAVNAMADMIESGKTPVPPDRIEALTGKRYDEPDFHYRYVDRLKVLAGERADAELARLRQHPDYLVRLKALNATESPTMDMRRQIFGSPWQRKVPEPVIALAQKLIAGGDPGKWQIETAKGTVTVALYGTDAPITCANIAYLANRAYFNGMPIHRVVPNFVVQAGDSRGDGSGGPGYAIPCEINARPYRRGSVGMALAGKDTGGSQFFICHSAQPHLDGGYTVFGEVVSGMDVVDRLDAGDLIVETKVMP